MLKRSALRRLIVAALALFVLLIIYLFPTETNNIEKEITYYDVEKSNIYLLDRYNYVARTEIVIQESDVIKKAKEILEALRVNSKYKDYLLNGFYQIIPEKTKILDISYDNNLLKVSFSKELLNIEKNLEEKMIEAIVFSLTEIKGVEKIMIFVEEEQLQKLPKTNKILPQVLTREFGINKEYNINSLKDVVSTTTYYVSKYDNNIYYVPITNYINSDLNKVKIIVDNLQTSPTRQTNLMSFLSSNASLLDYEIQENIAKLTWNNYIFNDITNKNILEEVKYSIYLSLQDTLNIEEVVFINNDKEILNFKNND